MSESEAPAADWYADPSGRFEYRYWDGTEWTGHVSTDGKTDWDPPGEAAPEEAAQSAGEQATADPAVAASAMAGGAAQDDGGAMATSQAGAVQVAEAPADQSGFAPEQPAEASADLPADHNLAANVRAGLDDDVRGWLDEVAEQVGPRLSRINRGWASEPQAEAAKACAYGLLIGHLATLHPHMKPELSSVAEVHESFSTLEAGQRLATLTDIAGDAERTAAWLGPLIGVTDPGEVAQLFD